MRTIGLALIAFFLVWGAAQAQVAAPRMNPLQFSAISSWNPAVYSWDGPSRFGGGLANGSLDFTQTGSSAVEVSAGDGMAGVIRLVGDSFAFGVDHWSLDMDIIPSFGGGSIKFENTTVGASFQMNEMFSIGVGQESGETLFTNELSTDTLPIAGATIRLGGVFYLGFAAGDETVEEEFTDIAGSAVEGDRGVTRFGLAYHSRDGGNGLHVEVWREETDAINTATFTNDGQEATGITLELVFSNILIGYEAVSGEEFSAVDGSVTEEEDGTTISLGWVPVEGLSIVVSITEIEVKDLTNGDLLVFNIAFAGLAWSF